MKKRILFLVLLISFIMLSGCDGYPEESTYEPGRVDPPGLNVSEDIDEPVLNVSDDIEPILNVSDSTEEPDLDFNPPDYSFTPKGYNNPEYDLPLTELPENYERDIELKFDMQLTEEQKQTLLENGVVIIPGEHELFDQAYHELNYARSYLVDGETQRDESGVPIIITTDSVMHLFHIEFNEMLKNIEIKKLTPMLDEFLEESIKASQAQYNGFEDEELKELSRRNIAYLAVAKKLLDPDYRVPSLVRDEVNDEIERIEDHKGFYQSPLFSKDCPEVCEVLLYPEDYDEGQGDICNQQVKDVEVEYEGEIWLFQDLYTEICIKSCYCEDYSQYVPRGHYTSSEELKQYFKAMMWLGRITFKVKGEGWTKQAILLTDAVKSADVMDLWNSIYTVTGFFAGASDDLTFYEYDTAIFNLFSYEFDEEEELKQQVAEAMQTELRKIRGPKILGGFEFDLAGNLKDTTQGLRLIGQRYAVDSHALSEMVYNNVGPNPDSQYYEHVLGYCTGPSCLGPKYCSKPKDFYRSCENMAENKTKYWNEVCTAALEKYCGCGGCNENLAPENIKKLYSVCRFMPTGLDVMSILDSERADELLAEKKTSTYCDYDLKNQEMKDVVDKYEDEWTQNLYNSWLWMLQPVLEIKPEGYPNWMRTNLWENKDLVTALSSWAQLRHDTILYVKQSYTRAGMTLGGSAGPMQAKYYGYVEPNPELYARAKFITEYLITGLEEQGVMTEQAKAALEKSRDMMTRLQEISEKELLGEALTEEDYDYIEDIDAEFNDIIEDLASALTVEGERPLGAVRTRKTLQGKNEAFKTTIIADVHTETNTKQVLEVGTGKIDWIIVAHESKEGRIGVAVGPMFSYYEFPWKMSDRLTDEKWRDEVVDIAERPDWIQEFIS